jgi:hypothetical protein
MLSWDRTHPEAPPGVCNTVWSSSDVIWPASASFGTAPGWSTPQRCLRHGGGELEPAAIAPAGVSTPA